MSDPVDYDPLNQRPIGPITLTDPDGRTVSVGGATVGEQNAEVDRLLTEWAQRQGRVGFVSNFQTLVSTMLTNHWAFLDAYSDRQWPDQDTQPADWPAPPGDPDPTSLAQAVTWVKRQMVVINQREQILRSQLSYVTYTQVREARLLQMMLKVVGPQIERDPTIQPPSDR